MEADKVKFLDGLEVQAELDAIWQEDQQKIAEEQRILVAQRIATEAAEAKKSHRRTCIVQIDVKDELLDRLLLEDIIIELNDAHWDVDLCENNTLYQIVSMDVIHTSDVPDDAPATPA